MERPDTSIKETEAMSIANLSIGLAFLGGLLTVLSPCVLPLLPLVVGRSLQSHRYGPVALVVGLVSGFAVAGSLLGVTSQWFAGFASALRSLALVLLLLLGFVSVFPQWRYWLFSYIRLGKLKPPTATGLTGEFWLGTQLGFLWTPCAGPALASILVLAAVNHAVAGAFVLLSAYGLGAGVPLLVIAYTGRWFSQSWKPFRSHSEAIQKAGGLLIAATAIAILLGWDVQIQLWLAPLFPPLPL
jgi:cytochrome c biogenesis protein CcdA